MRRTESREGGLGKVKVRYDVVSVSGYGVIPCGSRDVRGGTVRSGEWA